MYKAQESKVGILEVLISLILFIPTIALKGMVVARLYNWFIYPFFQQFHASFLFGVGISLIFSLLKGVDIQKEESMTRAKYWIGYISSIVFIFTSWFFGYIAYLILM